MKGLSILRVPTPLGWSLSVAALIVVAAVLGHGLGLRWDPFGLGQRRLERAEARVATADSDALARGLETEGMAGQARRLDQLHQQAVAAERATALATAQARHARLEEETVQRLGGPAARAQLLELLDRLI